MQRTLPNLDWLRVFAATAATESFSLAATELGVTAGAVSQRIKALEAFLGIALFQRHAQGVRLTPAGRRYAKRVQVPLEQLTLATRELTTGQAASVVRVTILPALAQLWLGPRLEQFHRLHSQATVEIWADPAVVDLRNSQFDVAVRYGLPPFPGHTHQRLLDDELMLVAAPRFAEAVSRDRDGIPIDASLMLDTYWPDDFDYWRVQAGIGASSAIRTQTFSLYSMAVEATLNGRGFMVGHSALVAGLIADGRLVLLSPHRIVAQNQFYLLRRDGLSPSSAASAFVDWMLDTARAAPT